MTDFNSYEDAKRAEAYARLEFPGTYYLAYRDIPAIIGKHVTGDHVTTGNKALDFGCGAGRSTRFLKKLGFDTTGIDISNDMLKIARERDPDGSYLLVGDGDFEQLENNSFDLVLSAFTFDNIATFNKKTKIFKEIRRVLKDDGRIISIVSSPEIYTHEWASFSTKNYPQNKAARCGDIVKIIITAIDDTRPVADIVWPHEDYLRVYKEVNLGMVEKYEPLAEGNEPYEWVNETRIAPWVIYVLKKVR